MDPLLHALQLPPDHLQHAADPRHVADAAVVPARGTHQHGIHQQPKQGEREPFGSSSPPLTHPRMKKRTTSTVRAAAHSRFPGDGGASAGAWPPLVAVPVRGRFPVPRGASPAPRSRRLGAILLFFSPPTPRCACLSLCFPLDAPNWRMVLTCEARASHAAASSAGWLSVQIDIDNKKRLQNK